MPHKEDTFEEKFKELWLENANTIYLFILACLRNEDDAQDALQIVAIKAYKGFDRLRDVTRFKQWGIQIARNTVIDFIKQQQAYKGVVEEVSKVVESTSRNEYSDIVDLVDDYIQNLPPPWDRALYLNLYYEQTAVFISKVLSVPVTTTARRLRNMRKELRRLIEDFIDGA